MRVEERFVPPPRFDRFLVERPAGEKEQLARLADNVIDEVCQRECREDERREPIRTGRGAAVSLRRTERAPCQQLTWRSNLFQRRLTRVLRERDLAVRGEGKRMFGPLCAGMRQLRRRGVIGEWCSEWFSAGRGRTPTWAARRRHLHSLRERCQAQRGRCCLGCQIRRITCRPSLTRHSPLSETLSEEPERMRQPMQEFVAAVTVALSPA